MVAAWIILARTAWGFGNVLALLLVLSPLTVLWAVAIVYLFQCDGLKRWERGVWLFGIVAVPFFGALSCLLVRPGISSPGDHVYPKGANLKNAPLPTMTRAEQLYMLANLHDAGKLTNGEFSAAKVLVLRDEARSFRP